MKMVSKVVVCHESGRFMVDVRCSYWFGGLTGCAPRTIPFEDLDVVIGELRHAETWLKRRAKLWESYEKVIDAWTVERDRRDAPIGVNLYVWDGVLTAELYGKVWTDMPRTIGHFAIRMHDIDAVIAELKAARSVIGRLKAAVTVKHPSPEYRDWLKEQAYYDDYLERLATMYGTNSSVYYYASEGWVTSWGDVEALFCGIAMRTSNDKWLELGIEAKNWYINNVNNK